MRYVLIACLLFFPGLIFCQRFGGTPPPVKWNQINTDTARIIFPSGLDSQAKRVATIVHHLAAHPVPGSGLSLGNKLHKIDIVLQNQTVIANGYVGLGPYRSEFYLTPALNNFDQGTIPWNDQLALHEYRHVQQFNNFNTGLSHAMRILFGQEGYALAVNASIPDWFYEGDAVYNETVLTRQGRGRLPLFLNAWPSLWQAGKNYSWMKVRNGSLKDYVPNHYYLGYLLVNYGREKYGLDFWSKVTQDAAAFKGLFYPFQKAIKRHAGVDYKQFREDAFNWYKQVDSSAIAGEALEGTAVFPLNKNVVTNYLFPYGTEDSSLIYLKTAYNKRPAFYIKNHFGERRLRTRDISVDEQFSYRNGKIVYAAYETDPRWSWRDYSVIKLLDVHTKKQQTIGHRTKYFTPDISPSGDKIAAVEVALNGKSEIHILDIATGKVTAALRSADINLFTDPKFIDDHSLVCVARLQNGKSALAIADVTTGAIERLTLPSFNTVGYPNVSEGFVYFTASYNGNDDVYVLRLDDRKIYRLTNGPLGNYFVNRANDKLTWSAFTAEGYQLRQMETKDQWPHTVTDTAIEHISHIIPVSHSDKLPDILVGLPSRDFSIKNYRKSKGLLNFHSWRPYYEDPVFTFSLYGENILNTLQTETYYLYNQNDKTNAAGFNAIYGGWFPYLSLGSEYTFDRQDFADTLLRRWSQLDSRIGLILPLNYTSGRTFKNFSLSSYYVLSNEFNKGLFKDSIGNTSFSYLSHGLTWSQQVQSAVQHIFPRLGYAVVLGYRHPITEYDGYQFYGGATLYLPGALNTHHLVLSGAFQQRDTLRQVYFGDRLAGARGYASYYLSGGGSRLWRLSANYHLPLLYPDWGFANSLYLQRFRANVFYDHQRLFSNDKLLHADLRSTGFELYADTKWWNQYELSFGIRVSRLLDDDPRGGNGKGSHLFEFLLPVSIFPR